MKLIDDLPGELGVAGLFLFFMICFSLILYFGCKSAEVGVMSLSKRYRTILWYRIFAKTLIPVPLVLWAIHTIGRLFFGYTVHFWECTKNDLIASWIIYCALIWVSRKIYRRIQRNKFEKLPSSFYDKNK